MTTTDSNGSAEGKAKKQLTALEAISKITKILDQLTPGKRRQVLAFINEPSDD